MMLPILAIAIAAIIDQEDVDHGGRWAEPGVALSDDCEAALELLLLRACGNGSAGGPAVLAATAWQGAVERGTAFAAPACRGVCPDAAGGRVR